ncbi:DNA repair protein complementing XP-C cells isoform X1 [Salmo salar]|uniref:DNA repair protein complementing XP-C cells isoform X1 n=1 Tax=Salmo salar TaxID=8030 RepID=A0ABM3CR75_SALSA|nr:DNA repair protein complementing XP-C cells-like isoform X1 [Salmo salar]
MTPESDIIPPFIRTRIYMYTVKPGGKEEEDDEDSVEDEECGREKRKAEFETYLRHMMNRFNKDVVEDTPKVWGNVHAEPRSSL